jgi:hypothetical protein
MMLVFTADRIVQAVAEVRILAQHVRVLDSLIRIKCVCLVLEELSLVKE